MEVTLIEAANRLEILGEAFRAGTVPRRFDLSYSVSHTELEAVEFAAAFLAVFVEALEDSDALT